MLLNSQTEGRYTKTMFFPILFKILPMREVDQKLQELKSIMKGFINEHKQDIDYENPRDFIDVYLTKMNNEESSRFHKVEPTDIEVCDYKILIVTMTTLIEYKTNFSYKYFFLVSTQSEHP